MRHVRRVNDEAWLASRESWYTGKAPLCGSELWTALPRCHVSRRISSYLALRSQARGLPWCFRKWHPRFAYAQLGQGPLLTFLSCRNLLHLKWPHHWLFIETSFFRTLLGNWPLTWATCLICRWLESKRRIISTIRGPWWLGRSFGQMGTGLKKHQKFQRALVLLTAWCHISQVEVLFAGFRGTSRHEGCYKSGYLWGMRGTRFCNLWHMNVSNSEVKSPSTVLLFMVCVQVDAICWYAVDMVWWPTQLIHSSSPWELFSCFDISVSICFNRQQGCSRVPCVRASWPWDWPWRVNGSSQTSFSVASSTLSFLLGPFSWQVSDILRSSTTAPDLDAKSRTLSQHVRTWGSVYQLDSSSRTSLQGMSGCPSVWFGSLDAQVSAREKRPMGRQTSLF